MNLSIFLNPFKFFQFFYDFEKILEILKNERNVMNFGHVFVIRFRIAQKNFLGD